MALKPESLEDLILVSSPEADGRGRVAYVVTRIDAGANRYKSSIWILEDGEYKPLTGGDEDKCPRWGPQGLLAFLSRRGFKEGEKGASVSVIDPHRGESWVLAKLRFGAYRIDWLPDGRGVIALARVPLDERAWKDYGERSVLKSERIPLWFNGEGWVFDRFAHLHAIWYPSGRVERLTSGEFNVVSYTVSPDSRLLAYAASESMLEPYLHRVYLLDVESGERRLLLEGYTVSGLAFGGNGSKLYLRGHRRERGVASHHRIYEVDLGSGEARCVTCAMDRNTVNGVNSDARGPSCSRDMVVGPDGRLYFTVNQGGRMVLYGYDPSSETVDAVVDMPGYTIDEFTLSGDAIIVTAMSPLEPKELYSCSSGGCERLTDYNRALREASRSLSLSHYSVGNREGQEIDYWVLGPREAGCERCRPWILYIHGGPKTSYGYGFIHEFLVLASNGFHVVYSNPRGSDGYSEEFADIRGDYGGRDYEDLMTVVDD
ncbi:MAG: prolyl oligopeptidase family serine peptidase, partial [Desulfurococcales archaeon]|nr:prolyl oligopeptidase family serine peptidase [Desulfurococcales archaeon]